MVGDKTKREIWKRRYLLCALFSCYLLITADMSLSIIVFMTMSNIYDEFFCENNLSLKAAIFAKISITDVLRRSKYACMKNKLNIHVCYTNTGEIIWCVTEKKPFASINNSFDKNSFDIPFWGLNFTKWPQTIIIFSQIGTIHRYMIDINKSLWSILIFIFFV